MVSRAAGRSRADGPSLPTPAGTCPARRYGSATTTPLWPGTARAPRARRRRGSDSSTLRAELREHLFRRDDVAARPLLVTRAQRLVQACALGVVERVAVLD